MDYYNLENGTKPSKQKCCSKLGLIMGAIALVTGCLVTFYTTKLFFNQHNRFDPTKKFEPPESYQLTAEFKIPYLDFTEVCF